ncbi:MAG: Flp family type IVb pilin [Azospirillum brasilense]|nr:MAG: Flp family type IVb pilin [Azospirillum brasilense]
MKRFFQCERGATAIEYGLIVALVVLVMVVGLSALGGGSTSLFGTTSSEVTKATSGVN